MKEIFQTVLSECPEDETKGYNLLILGDVALSGKVAKAFETQGASYFFAKLSPNIFNTDCVLFNLECCLTDRGSHWEPKPVLMRGQSEYLKIFPLGNQLYIANVANNHFLDYGALGASDTIEALHKRQFNVIGATIKNEAKSSFIDSKEGHITFLAFAPCAHALKIDSEINVTIKSDDEIIKDVELAAKCSDVVIVSLHQGVEFSQYTDKLSRDRARRIINAGASLVVCHHTHVIQGIEHYNNSIIFYGIGNLLIDIDTNKRPEVKYSIGIRVQVLNKKIYRTSIHFFKLTDYLQVVNIEGDEKAYLQNKVIHLSKLLATPHGVFFNYSASAYLWFKLHISSLIEMAARKGIIDTITYFSNRILKKLLSFTRF